MEHRWQAKRTFLCDPLHFTNERLEARPDSFHEEHVLLFGSCDKRPEFGCVEGHGFFAEDMLPSAYGVERVGVVESVGGAFGCRQSLNTIQPLIGHAPM